MCECKSTGTGIEQWAEMSWADSIPVSPIGAKAVGRFMELMGCDMGFAGFAMISRIPVEHPRSQHCPDLGFFNEPVTLPEAPPTTHVCSDRTCHSHQSLDKTYKSHWYQIYRYISHINMLRTHLIYISHVHHISHAQALCTCQLHILYIRVHRLLTYDISNITMT